MSPVLHELRELIESSLTALLPPACGACGAALAARPIVGLCECCLALLEENHPPFCPRCGVPECAEPCERCRRAPPPFTTVVAPYLYGGPLAEAIMAMKFGPREDLAHALGRLLVGAARARAACESATCLVPVPLGPRRRRTRGFNQAALLARELGAAMQVPVVHALKRTRNTTPQSDLALAQRAANVAGAFASRRHVTGRCVLVDDVVTSGETVRQAAAALTAAGASEVIVVALARTPAD